jgi:hypothetical protein
MTSRITMEPRSIAIIGTGITIIVGISGAGTMIPINRSGTEYGNY